MSMEANVAAWRFLISSLAKNVKSFETLYILTKILLLVESCLFFSFSLSLSFAKLNVRVLSNLRMLKLNLRLGLCLAYV